MPRAASPERTPSPSSPAAARSAAGGGGVNEGIGSFGHGPSAPPVPASPASSPVAPPVSSGAGASVPASSGDAPSGTPPSVVSGGGGPATVKRTLEMVKLATHGAVTPSVGTVIVHCTPLSAAGSTTVTGLPPVNSAKRATFSPT